MVAGDGVGAVESVDNAPGTEGIVALGVEKVLESVAGEVAPVGFAQDHSLNQNQCRYLGIQGKFGLLQERQSHQITHPLVILIPCQLDIPPAVVDLVRPGVRLAILFDLLPVRFPRAFTPLLNGLHGMRGFVIRSGQHVGAPPVDGHLELVECSQLMEDPLPMAVVQSPVEERTIDFLKEELSVHNFEELIFNR